jgi:hypothetical protein
MRVGQLATKWGLVIRCWPLSPLDGKLEAEKIWWPA